MVRAKLYAVGTPISVRGHEKAVHIQWLEQSTALDNSDQQERRQSASFSQEKLEENLPSAQAMCSRYFPPQ